MRNNLTIENMTEADVDEYYNSLKDYGITVTRELAKKCLKTEIEARDMIDAEILKVINEGIKNEKTRV